MWYKDSISKLDKNKIYNRRQLYAILSAAKTDLSFNSFNWTLNDIVSKGMITKKARDMYLLADDSIDKSIYIPIYNEKSNELILNIEKQFPYLDFVCFESVMLNEFLNHLISRNTIFIMVEKDASDFVFRYLQEETDKNILLRPNSKEWDAYWNQDSIIVLNLVSESPMDRKKPHEITIEKLLVDIIAEKSFGFLISKSEVEGIFRTAAERYKIDTIRLMRYAKRRNKASEIMNLLEECSIA